MAELPTAFATGKVSGSFYRKRVNAAIGLQTRDNMDRGTNGKNINPPAKDLGHQYNWQHMIFVTKYRYKMFRNPKTVEIIGRAINEEARKFGMTVKELSFGEDYAHVHMEIDVPNTLSVAQVAQLLKGYSSYIVFKEMPNHRLRYPRGTFWSAGYSNGSVGPANEETIKNNIRRQDISRGQMQLAM